MSGEVECHHNAPRLPGNHSAGQVWCSQSGSECGAWRYWFLLKSPLSDLILCREAYEPLGHVKAMWPVTSTGHCISSDILYCMMRIYILSIKTVVFNLHNFLSNSLKINVLYIFDASENMGIGVKGYEIAEWYLLRMMKVAKTAFFILGKLSSHTRATYWLLQPHTFAPFQEWLLQGYYSFTSHIG